MDLLTNLKPSSPSDQADVVVKRPLSYHKMENLIKEMQDPEHGVPVRSQKLFLTSIKAAFAGYDIIEWLMERLNIEDSVEAIHIANLLCQHGYFFPVTDGRLTVKDDSSLYRFQTPYYWPSQVPCLDNVDYAIYLAKRSLRNKQKHALEEYEVEALNSLRKSLVQKWDFISMQADEQIRITKERKKVEKMVTDSQERAFWRVLRPPPSQTPAIESPPMCMADFHANHDGVKKIRQNNILEDLRSEVELLRTSCIRTRIKVSQALESLAAHCEAYHEHEPFLVQRQPSNPWISDDPCYWIINAQYVDVPMERRVKKWAISMEDLVFDPTGLREFTAYLKKEYCHENIRFWSEVLALRNGPISQVKSRAEEIYNTFLCVGAPCEINIDMRTMEKVQRELKSTGRLPSRFTFDPAAEHVYTMLLKKDCYPRFIRSEHYKSLLHNALQPATKKRFFSFGVPKKKSSATTAPIFPVAIQSATAGVGEVLRATDELMVNVAGRDLSHISSSTSILDVDRISTLSECPYRGDLVPPGEEKFDSLKKSKQIFRSVGDVKEPVQLQADDCICPWEMVEKLPEKEKPGPAPPTLSKAKSSETPKTKSSATDTTTPKLDKSAIARGTMGLLSFPLLSTSIQSQPQPILPIIPSPVTKTQQISTTVAEKASVPQVSSPVPVPVPVPVPTTSIPVSASTSSETIISSTTPKIVSSTSISLALSPPKSSSPLTALTTCTSTTTSTPTMISSSIMDIKLSPTLKRRVSTVVIPPLSNTIDEVDEEQEEDDDDEDQKKITIPAGSAPTKVVDERVKSGEQTKIVDQKPQEQEKEKEKEKGKEQQAEENIITTTISSTTMKLAPLTTSPPIKKKSSVEHDPTDDEGESSTKNQQKGKLSTEKSRSISKESEKENLSQICPWDSENGTKPETTTFVKTYSTLGYL